MITGELKSKIDRIWDAMWAGGIANPLTVIEQLTYLLFIKRLDELHTLRERKAARTGKPIDDPIFPTGKNPASRQKRAFDDLRWSRFRDFAPETVFEVIRDEVFPFLKTLGKGTAEDGSDSTYAHHMKDALFMFPSLTVNDDQQFMSALILVFAWINGGHPYAYYRTHERDGAIVHASLQPLQRTPSCLGRLISPFGGGTTAAEVLDCGIRFFKAGGQLAEDLRLFLWQYRDATTDGSITPSMLLQGCALLEGVVGLTLRLALGYNKGQIGKLKVHGQVSTDNSKGHAEARFCHAGTHLGFDWNHEFQPVFKTWKEVRNALAHGDLGRFWDDLDHPVLEPYRQIMQAFNAITLRLIGYKGDVCMDDRWFAIRS